jgi:small conductance mechanosensitive channel
METYLNSALEWLRGYGPNVIAAFVIFIFGWTAAKLIRRILRRTLLRASFDETLSVFLSRLAYMLLLAFVVIVTIQKLGVDTTSFAAVIAAAGLAIGLALHGSLSNFASGVLLIALRPFKVGDYVEVGGTAGTVAAVAVFATELLTPDNRKIFVPNSTITSGTITNYSANDTRRVDLVVGVSYDADLHKARQVLEGVLSEDSRVLKEPAPVVAVSKLGESSVDFVVRPWVRSEDYWPVAFDLNERMKVRLEKEGITIPFPQRHVHLHQVGESKSAS